MGSMQKYLFDIIAVAARLCVAALVSGCAATSVQPVVVARPRPGLATAYIPEQGRTIEPFSHVLFCQRYPAECAAANGAKTVEWSSLKHAELQSINRLVNTRILPRNDAEDDVWSLSPRSGDCEDYAVTKRHLPASALRLAIGYTASGEGHLVLAVRTDGGDVILDNETNAIRNWRDAGLTWQEIQSSGDPRIWYKI